MSRGQATFKAAVSSPEQVVVSLVAGMISSGRYEGLRLFPGLMSKTSAPQTAWSLSKSYAPLMLITDVAIRSPRESY